MSIRLAHRRAIHALVVLAVVIGLTPVVTPPAEALPTGFRDQLVLTGLDLPTVTKFAGDGRIFVGEKSGLIKVFDGLGDPTPQVFADLRTQVHNYWDRGLLGLELHPDFPRNPSVYALYTHDAAIRGAAPRWGVAGATSDNCPTPPGPTADGCVASGRLTRLTATGNRATAQQVLLDDWCIQYPSHTIGSLRFGQDRALYVSGGDGASFTFADYGQRGAPSNPCGDPPAGTGGIQRPPTAQGGALRSQDLRTGGDPVGLGGTILRIDPMTGAGLPGNPFYSSPDPNARRVVAYGLRNPSRFTVRPGTSEVWVGDVGWTAWEEINRVANPIGGAANFGWPCHEGAGRQPGYDALNLNLCENLYAQGGVTAPYFTYRHGASTAPNDGCGIGGASITGVEFYGTGTYPAAYNGAMFFSDYSRGCIWVLRAGADGLPDPTTLAPFVAPAAAPVNLQIGPGGDLYYTDIAGGAVHRITYTANNTTPTARATATPAEGAAPLTVTFDGGQSTDPDVNDRLTYAWDLDGDQVFDDAATATARWTYTSGGTFTATLKVTDTRGAVDTVPVRVDVDNGAPAVSITSPTTATTWRVGDTINLSGQAVDPQEGNLPPEALSWSLIMHHCATPDACHAHRVQDLEGVATGSFVAPDHDFPSYLEVRLTARDTTGLTATQSLRVNPQTIAVAIESDQPGLRLVLNGEELVTPASRRVIVGSQNVVSAPDQELGGNVHRFSAWSDGGERTHSFVAGDATASLRASYTASPAPIRINAGGPAVTAFGVTWGPDRHFTNGRVYQTAPGVDIAGTNNDILYRTERSGVRGVLNYRVPVPSSGQYAVKLHFAEIFFGAPGGRPGGRGSRVFSANLEGGARELSNLDIIAARGPMRALVTAHSVVVRDGFLNLDMAASANAPTLSAIEVLWTGDAPPA